MLYKIFYHVEEYYVNIYKRINYDRKEYIFSKK